MYIHNLVKYIHFHVGFCLPVCLADPATLIKAQQDWLNHVLPIFEISKIQSSCNVKVQVIMMLMTAALGVVSNHALGGPVLGLKYAMFWGHIHIVAFGWGQNRPNNNK